MPAGVPIFVYHSIDESGSPISVSPRRFRAQMADLARRGHATLSIDQLAALAAGRLTWPERAVALIFDDALETIRTDAHAVLESFGFCASVAVVTSRVGLDNAWPGQPAEIPRFRVLDWSELADLGDAGWGIISHTHTHAALDRVTPDQLQAEMDTSIDLLVQHLDRRPLAIAYPYGIEPTGSLEPVAARFAIALGGGNRPLRPDDGPMRWPRIESRYYLPALPCCRPGGAGFGPYLGIRHRLRSLARGGGR